LLDTSACEELTRVELRLRQQPDQTWTPRKLLAEISSSCGVAEDDAALNRIRHIAACRAELPKRQSPAAWVALFDAVLGKIRWPGESPLDSSEFQLFNRWRELLNDVARLELVSSTMTAGEASGRVAAIAGETVFQPESDDALVQVMGPLEAAGLSFGQLWITGVTDRNWPAASRPLSLVSRDLQRSHGMPDATPTDTLDFARRVLQRLTASAQQVIVSFPSTEDDVQQSASELLQEFNMIEFPDASDPGWHARAHSGSGAQLIRAPDPVPPVTASEIIAGGAATLQRQVEDPFGAFVTGRLGVQVLWPIAPGLPPVIRGSLIHAALHRLYEECPSREAIRAWISSDLDARLERAVRAAFRVQERNADAVLRRLLQLEKMRVKNLLRSVVELDANRNFIRVHAVEQKFELRIEGLNLRVRLDRVDLCEADEALIIDYKTGVPRALLDRDKNLKDLQLMVYARAIPGPVGGIGLLNVDSRGIELDAIGRAQMPGADWDAQLSEWQEPLTRTATQMSAGDVRVSRWQTARSRRAFALLSRYQELLLEQ
jgi:probable DNA repair protein